MISAKDDAHSSSPHRSRITRRRGMLIAAGSLAVLAGSAVLVPGCSAVYVARQSLTHLRVLAARQPVDRAIARGKIPDDWLPKIETIRKARAFGSQRLGLPTDDLYTTISVVRPSPTWVVTASPKDRLQPVTWWFPVVGRVAYRGYYDRQDALRFAGRLRQRDLDVLVQPASAFSTLGWFSDPIRPSMLQEDEAGLADLVLHEAAHRVLYIKGQTNFNESFASFIGEEGALLFLRDRHGAGCVRCGAARTATEDARIFSGLLASLVADLKRLYAEPLSRDQKILRREAVFRQARARFRELAWRGDSFAWFPRLNLDNAVVLSLRRYQDRRPLFEDLRARCGGSLSRTLLALEEMDRAEFSRADWKRSDPFTLLEQFLQSASPCPVP
ncbi:MAG: aminopeptidase [Acidobacteriota bacterium]